MGYLEARYPAGRRVLAADLVDRYGLQRTALARLLPRNPVLSLWLLLGDVDVDEVRLEEGGWADFGSQHNPNAPSIHGLFVVGDLRVRGPVHNRDAAGAQSLFVMGDMRAEAVAVNGAELVVRGTSRVETVICCSGNGETWFDGDVEARLIASDNSPIWISGRLAAPVLETATSRIGMLDPRGVRVAPGDVPPSAVLLPEMRPDGSSLSFEALHAAVTSNRPVLLSGYATGDVDLDAVRKARESRREADTAMAEGRYLTAARLFEDQVAADEDAGVRLDLADALFARHERNDDHEGLLEALRLLDSVLGTRPRDELVRANPRVLLQRASIHLQLDGFGTEADGLDQAWTDCAQVLAVLPEEYHAVAHHLMGRLLYVKRHYAECAEHLRRALQLDPGLEDIHVDLAKVLWMLDREADAVPHATQALRGQDVDDFVHYVRGKCLQRLERYDEAHDDLRIYHDLHPDDPFTTVSLMEIDLKLGRAGSALQLARAAVDREPTDLDAVTRYGRVLAEAGLTQQAVPFLRHAVELEPEDASLVRDLAVALLTDATAHQTLSDEGDPATADVLALGTALRLLEIAADDVHLRYLRGECFRILGELAAAERDLSAYLDQHPDAAAGMASLARVYLAHGRDEEARQAIRKALRGDPDSEYVRHASRHLVRIEGVRPLL